MWHFPVSLKFLVTYQRTGRVEITNGARFQVPSSDRNKDLNKQKLSRPRKVALLSKDSRVQK